MTGLGTVLVLVLFVLPRFVGIFLELRVAIPLPLRAIVWTQAAVFAWWPFMLASGAAAAAGLGAVEQMRGMERFVPWIEKGGGVILVLAGLYMFWSYAHPAWLGDRI